MAKRTVITKTTGRTEVVTTTSIGKFFSSAWGMFLIFFVVTGPAIWWGFPDAWFAYGGLIVLFSFAFWASYRQQRRG